MTPATIALMPDDRLIVRHGDQLLLEYVARPQLDAWLAPRPYAHPVCTLSGITVTDHQPGSHAWHLGLAYGWPVVNDWNLWGGPSYRRDEGYVELDNIGSMHHESWENGTERLAWLDPGGSVIAVERRRLGPAFVDEAAGAWSLRLEVEIECRLADGLRLGSPTTEGRPMAGYAGLAWRGTDSLLDAKVLFAGGPAHADPMGQRSMWAAAVGGGVTVAMADHADNPRVPERWFVRTAPHVLLAASPLFDEPLEIPNGGRLRLRHTFFVADGAWDVNALRAALSAAPARKD